MKLVAKALFFLTVVVLALECYLEGVSLATEDAVGGNIPERMAEVEGEAFEVRVI